MGSGFISPGHIAVLLVVVLLVFGAKRLPEMGRSLGHGMREFKDSVSGDGPALPAISDNEVATAPADMPVTPRPSEVSAIAGERPHAPESEPEATAASRAR